MHVLVTGGAGFIGSSIVRALLAEGARVRVLDNFSSGKMANLDEVAHRIEIINGDIRDYWTVQRATDGIDAVLHQAALASVPASVANPMTAHEINVTGTCHVLEAARLAGAKRMVIASSAAIYGDTTALPINEGTDPNPLSPYAVHKYTNEQYCRVYTSLYGFPTVCLRYFNIFGPRQDPQSDYAPVIPKFINRFLAGQAPTVFGDGLQSRDFAYVDNAVAANLMALTRDDMVGGVFNVACGERYTLNDLLETLREIMDIDINADYTDPRPGDIVHSYASIDKIRTVGYSPAVGWRDGLTHTVAFFRAEFERSVTRSAPA